MKLKLSYDEIEETKFLVLKKINCKILILKNYI